MPSITVSGWSIPKFVRVKVPKCGLMAPCTRVIGSKERLTARVDSFTPTEMSTTDSGKMIKHTAREFTPIWTAQGMKVIGKKINNTGRVLRRGLMVPATAALTLMAKSMAMVVSLGLTILLTLGSLLKTILKVKAPTTGVTEGCTRATGKIIRWKVRGSLSGPMAESTSEITVMIKRRVRVPSTGPTAGSTRAPG